MCFGALRARHADLDPILELPYGPAACELPHYEAGHTKAPDHLLEPEESPCIQRGVHTRNTHQRQRITPRSPPQFKIRPLSTIHTDKIEYFKFPAHDPNHGVSAFFTGDSCCDSCDSGRVHPCPFPASLCLHLVERPRIKRRNNRKGRRLKSEDLPKHEGISACFRRLSLEP